MKHIKSNLICVGIILAAFSANQAQAQTKIGSKTQYTGNRKIGGKLRVFGKMEQRSYLVRASGKISGYVRLFNRTHFAARVEAKSTYLYDGRTYNTAKVTVAGYRVHSRTRPYGWQWNMDHSQTLFQRDRTILVRGIPINLEIRVGGTLYSSLEIGTSFFDAGAGLQGTTGVKAWGSVATMIDLGLYRVGVKAVGTFLDYSLKTGSYVTFNGMEGHFRYHCDPIKIALKLALDKATLVRKGWRIKRQWEEVRSQPLTTWTGSSFSHTFLEW